MHLIILLTRFCIFSFLDTYTSWNSSKKGQQTISVKHGGALLKGMFPPCDAFFSVDDVFATEEWALVPELGLKGNVRGRINPVHSSTTRNGDGVEQDALVPVELKTGHNQNPQHNHWRSFQSTRSCFVLVTERPVAMWLPTKVRKI